MHHVASTLLILSFSFAGSVTAGQDPTAPHRFASQISDRFAFVWDSVEVSAQVFSPSYTGPRNLHECARSLTVVGEVHVLDSNDLVGMQVVDPDVLQAVDSDGNDVSWAPLPSRPLRQYQQLKYEWPDPRDPSEPLRPVLQPYDVSVSFCLDPTQELPSALSLFQWSAQAVYAEEVIEVDVPFAKTDDWLQVAPGVQIKVTKATIECCDYTYWTEVKHPDGIVRAFDGRFSPAEPIADYLVVRTLLLDADGNPIRATQDDRVTRAIWSQRFESTSWNTAKCAGWLLTFTTEAEVASIRHIIVVRPCEVEIPFTSTNLPCPSLCPWR